MKTRWLRVHAPRADAQHRLFCFPHAGGGGSAYRLWPAGLPKHVEVVTIELPGRESRFGEPPTTRLATIVDEVVEAASPLMDRPYALFGHSMGALLAFEVAVRLQALSAPSPSHLFVSGRRAPTVRADEPPLRHLPDDAFVAELNRRYDGIPKEILEHRDLLDLLLPVVRADIAALETHEVTRDVRLECPISAFGGLGDRHASRTDLDAWRDVASAPVPVRQFPGGHFYLGEQRAALLHAVAGALTGPVVDPRSAAA